MSGRPSHNPLRNQRGSVIIVTMIIIAVVIAIFSGIVGFRLTELSRQSHQVNEAYRYLNVMEEMGMMLARARTLGKAGSCPAPLTKWTYHRASPAADFDFCFTGSTLANTCIVDDSQKDTSAASIKYCLDDVIVAKSDGSDRDYSNVAGLSFKIKKVGEPSLIEKAYRALVSPFESADAACAGDWANPCGPTNVTSGSFQGATNEVSNAPAAYAAIPGGASPAGKSSGHSSSNLESWVPADPTWSPGGSNSKNEIYTPICDPGTVTTPLYPQQYWLGCMSCNDLAGQNTCIDIEMCPPNFKGATSCSHPYRQRILIY